MSTALYRRYRPETFADVIGQEHVTEPLMAAIDKDRINHAYLFSGPRGCGKTTSARILARCLNCAQGPTSTPCGVCDSCVELARNGSGSLDVIEIDAASHGGVDDARDLRERATFAPVRDRFKIFIIDEAHMVTSAGFNALLKIVEEPPEHILFIFATTEPDKVIGTIRSRTHHYPFRLVPPEPLMGYLELLCRQENVAVAPGVLSLVIRAGGGSVRDSLSVLDQLMAGAGEAGLDYELAVSLLGYTHATLLDDVVESIAAEDAGTVFDAVDRVIQTGHDPRRFVEDLLERFRDLIVINAVPEGASSILRGVPEDQLNRMRTQATQLGAGELSRAADVTNTALTEMTGATSPRLHLELLCARLLLPAADATVRGTLARVDRIERRLEYAGGNPSGAVPAEADSGAELDAAPAQPDAAPAVAPARPVRPRLDVPRNAEEAAARWSLPAAEPATPAAGAGEHSPAVPAAVRSGRPGQSPSTVGSSPDWGGAWGVSSNAASTEAPSGQHGPGAGPAPAPAPAETTGPAGTSEATAPGDAARGPADAPGAAGGVARSTGATEATAGGVARPAGVTEATAGGPTEATGAPGTATPGADVFAPSSSGDGTRRGGPGMGASQPDRSEAGASHPAAQANPRQAANAPAGTPGPMQNRTPGPAAGGPAGTAQARGGRGGPAQNAPAQNRPGQDAPAQNGPGRDGPAQNGPAQNAPGHDGLRGPADSQGQPAARGGGSIEMVRRAWPEIMDEVARIKRATWLIVNVSAKPRSFEGNQLVLAFANQGTAIGFQRGPHLDNVKQAIHRVLGLTCSIEAVHDADGVGESGPKVPPSGNGPGSPDPGSPVPAIIGSGPASEASARSPKPASPAPSPEADRGRRSVDGQTHPTHGRPSAAWTHPMPSEPSAEPTGLPRRTPSPDPEPAAGRPTPTTSRQEAARQEAVGAWDPSMTDDSWALVEPPEEAFDPGPGGGTAGDPHGSRAAGESAQETRPGRGAEQRGGRSAQGPGAGGRPRPGDGAAVGIDGAREDGRERQGHAASARTPATGPVRQGSGPQPSGATPAGPTSRSVASEGTQPPASRSVVWSPPAPGPASSHTSSDTGGSASSHTSSDTAGPASSHTSSDTAGPGSVGPQQGQPGGDHQGVPATRARPAGPVIPSFIRRDGSAPGIGPDGVPTEPAAPDQARSEDSRPAPNRADPAPSGRTGTADAPARTPSPPGPPQRPGAAPQAVPPGNAGPSAATSGRPSSADPALQKPVSRYQQLLDEAERKRAEEAAAVRGSVDLRFVEDEPSADDETIEESGLVGRAAIERILNGRLVEERGPDGR